MSGARYSSFTLYNLSLNNCCADGSSTTDDENPTTQWVLHKYPWQRVDYTISSKGIADKRKHIKDHNSNYQIEITYVYSQLSFVG